MSTPPLQTTWKALRALGPRPLASYAAYRLGLASGFLRRMTSAPPPLPEGLAFHPPLPSMPDQARLAAMLGSEGQARLVQEAAEILAGKARLFGGPAGPLDLNPGGPLLHWTLYERGDAHWGGQDPRLLWEPGRFGWAFTLGRAFLLTGDPRYSQAFWSYTETFLDVNPPYLGPHWVSGQEAALRLMALVFAGQVFGAAPESTPGRMALLVSALAAHAARIPPSLIYARAQNNNHLVTEAAGLYTAGLALPAHPQAGRWQVLGWTWLNRALQAQISTDGAYSQHSANYQRLMLQAALWARALAVANGQGFPLETSQALAAAARWSLALMDSASGRMPNLGPNDGALILPLACCSFEDHRPTLQASARAFLGEAALPPGPWDELSLWLAPSAVAAPPSQARRRLPGDPALTPHILVSPDGESWAYLRVARFTSRPGHADQLHMDLWWRGHNLARDPGTYRYTAPAPWDNALAGTAVHNTLTLDGLDQMTPAGRFLWLDWAQAWVVDREPAPEGGYRRLVARHDAYRLLGAVHQRTVRAEDSGGWLVEDLVLPAGEEGTAVLGARRRVSLTWLLPDWEWALEEGVLSLQSPYGDVRLAVEMRLPEPGGLEGGSTMELRLTRAGELLVGTGAIQPTWGWFSPTYGQRVPALTLEAHVESRLPVTLVTRWDFP